MHAFKTAILAAAMVIGAGAAAQAADANPDQPVSDVIGFYVRADAGWSFLDWTKNDNAPVLGGGIGYQFTDYLRADLRADWAGNYDIAPGADASITSVLGNAYLDIPTGTAFTPYVGAGGGYGWVNLDKAPDKSGFAYDLTAGVDIGLSQNISLDVGYRFRDVMVKGTNPMEHQVLAGLRFSF